MLSDRFLQTSNLFNILRQISMFGILSVLSLIHISEPTRH